MSSRVSNHVTASRGSFVSSDLRVGSRRSRPSGASIRPLRERGRPRTSARYRRSTVRARIASWSAECATPERATTSNPDVSRSRRWTIPGRSGSSPPAAPSASSCPASVPSEAPGSRVDGHAGRLVDDEEVLVLVCEADRDGLGPEARRSAPPAAVPRRPSLPRGGGSCRVPPRRRSPRHRARAARPATACRSRPVRLARGRGATRPASQRR